MEEIRTRSRKREQEKRKEKTYDQYDWLKLAMDGGLKNLKVIELDKYLESNGITKYGKKDDKIKTITCHVIRANANSTIGQEKIDKHLAVIADVRNSDTCTSQSDSSDDDEVVAMLSEDSTEELQEFDDSTSGDFQTITVTRSGRVVGSWKNACIRNYQM